MLTDEQRQAIVEETKTWLKTPYRGWSRIKGAGVDCGQILAAVFIACGHIPSDTQLPAYYSLSVAQHKEDTEYIDLVEKYMREIPESEVKPGDVVVYKLGKAFAHSAFVVSWPEQCIHAMARHGVTYTHGLNHPKLRRTEKKFYTLREKFTGTKEVE